MPAKSTILIILLLAPVALMARPPKDSNKDNKKKRYYPVEYISTSGMTNSQYNNNAHLYWYYDKEGRLTGDSIRYSYGNQNEQDYRNAESFVYIQDSVIMLGYNNDTSYTRFTASGMPMSEALPFGNFAHAYYKPNGEMWKFDISRAAVSRRGQIEYLTTVSDSIVYDNGNIVSYRFRNPNALKTVLYDTPLYVYCTYYDYDIRAMDFYPIMRIKGLSDNQMSQWGSLDPALFSRHLVKSIETPTFRLSFKYVIDEEGKVIGIDREWIYNNSSMGYTMSDHATIKYAYR